MANAEEFRAKLEEFKINYPQSFKIMRGENDINLLNFDKIMQNPSKDFANTDDMLIHHITKCLQEGKDVAIQAAGRDVILVHAARDLFKKSYY